MSESSTLGQHWEIFWGLRSLNITAPDPKAIGAGMHAKSAKKEMNVRFSKNNGSAFLGGLGGSLLSRVLNSCSTVVSEELMRLWRKLSDNIGKSFGAFTV